MPELVFLDLQLFAGEKTEKATPRKRQKAREKGQVFRSNDLNSALIVIAVFAVIFFGFSYMLESMQGFTREYLSGRWIQDFTMVTARTILLESIYVLSRIIVPILAVATLAGLVGNLMQVGFLFSTEPLTIKLERLNPIEGLKRIFSKRAMVEFIKSVLKLTLTAGIVFHVISKNISLFPLMMDMEIAQSVKNLLNLIFEMAMKIGIALFALGVLDYLYQRWEHEKSLKMTKHEVKEEHKQMEGDPQIRARQRQRQREMAMRRMMAEVPKADVVITNPTHYAIALRYEAEYMDAPMVVAKGVDFMAQRIKKVARESGVTIVENQELARNLYYICDLGDVIPENLYQAVAQVLAFVYRQKQVQ
ncbi:MAG: flagellar biosynthesis protein FlhB [Syntrophomonadales bacterium]